VSRGVRSTNSILFGELELVVLPEAIREDLPRELHGEIRRDAAPEIVTLAARDKVAQTHPAAVPARSDERASFRRSRYPSSVASARQTSGGALPLATIVVVSSWT
jgi:hypothetical protein